jgi:sugar (pentulose or hexulose) kinase
LRREDDCFLGLDLGTSGCRAVAVDAAGHIRARASVPLPAPSRSPDGGSWQDPKIWWQATLDALRRLGRDLRPLSARALAVDGTATTLLLAAPDGTPLGPAMMYDDRRARDQAQSLRRIVPDSSPAQGVSSSLAKLLYLIGSLAPPSGSLALHQADWVSGRLCGRYGGSDWNNCLRMGFNPAREHWPKWLERVPLGGIDFPRVVAPGTPVGTLSPEVAATTGLPRELVVRAGTTDSTASVLAAGISAPGDGVSVLGSTLVVKLVSDRPVTSAVHGVYSHRVRDLWLAGGASNSGGAVLGHFFSPERIQALSQGLDPERPSGLDYYPLLRPGERFPTNDPEFPPRLDPRPEDERRFLQGLLEGIARIEARGYRLLEELGAPPVRRVTSIGGGAGNEPWRRIRERLLGVPVVAAVHQDAAFGAALLARGD